MCSSDLLSAGPGHAPGELGEHLRVGGLGAYTRQVPGRTAVEGDELVGLRPREGATAGELIEPVPLVPARGAEGIDIHTGSVTW